MENGFPHQCVHCSARFLGSVMPAAAFCSAIFAAASSGVTTPHIRLKVYIEGQAEKLPLVVCHRGVGNLRPDQVDAQLCSHGHTHHMGNQLILLKHIPIPISRTFVPNNGLLSYWRLLSLRWLGWFVHRYCSTVCPAANYLLILITMEMELLR